MVTKGRADFSRYVHVAREQRGNDGLLLGARNLALGAELRNLLRAFRDRDLSCAPLRGIGLSERLHGRFGTRPMGDIDLLVEHRDLPSVRFLLKNLRYREVDRRRGFSDSFSNTLKFVREADFLIIVEPHWTIAYPPFLDAVDMDAVWGRCVATRVLGEPTLSLGSEDLLVHLALHLAHRNDAPTFWFRELGQFTEQEAATLDWSLVVSICDQAGFGPLVARILSKAVSNLSARIPIEVIGELAATRAAQKHPLAHRLAENAAVREREGVAQFFALGGVRQRLRYVRMLFFPSAEFMMLEYGLERRAQLAPAYLARFVRFGWEGLQGIAQVLAKPQPNSRWRDQENPPGRRG